MQLNMPGFNLSCMHVFIRENAWVAKIAAKKLRVDQVAIVFGKTIYLYNTSHLEFIQHQAWVCHELKHVQQYRRYGFVGFLVRYLFESIRKGYYHNKFEIEARAAETDQRLLTAFKLVPA